jgi:hypothetical protein
MGQRTAPEAEQKTSADVVARFIDGIPVSARRIMPKFKAEAGVRTRLSSSFATPSKR